jgi:hypothetical protein
MAKIDAWAARMDEEVKSGFKRMAEYRAKVALEPAHRRIWA